MAMHFKIITPLRTALETEVVDISAPATEGIMEILPGHADLITSVANGELTYRPAGQEAKSLFIGGGFLQVEHDTVLLVTDTALNAADIDTDSVKNSVFGIETDVLYQWAKFPDYELKYTKIRNVNVRNVHAKCANWAVNVQGDAHEPVRGIRLENVSLDAARKGFSNIVNAKDVVMKDVALGDAEPTKWQQPIDEVWHRK